MGNRATVVFWNGEEKPKERSISPAVYLHWNGGPESIYAFLEELDRRGVRADQEYECARFIQLVGEFFTWSTQRDLTDPIYRESAYGLSLGVVNGPKSPKASDMDKVWTDHGDNGLYLVNRTLKSHETGYMRRYVEKAHLKTTGEQVEWGDQPYSEIEFKFVELAAEEVMAEWTEALESDYLPDIRKFYELLERRAPAPEEVPA